MSPSVPRVKIVVMPAHVVVIEEVNLPRGDWKRGGGDHGDAAGALDFYVAFGGPGTPRGIDVHLVPVGDGSLEPDDDERGEVVPIDRAPRRPATAYALLGRETMAGVVLHVTEDALSRALAPGNMAALRVRTVLDRPEEDPSGGRGVLVRLGAPGGAPLTLGRVVVEAAAGVAIAAAEARLCGPEADPRPLAVRGAPRRPGGDPPVAPVLALRHASDDLCVRTFTGP
jgi:hypothetical protein